MREYLHVRDARHVQIDHHTRRYTRFGQSREYLYRRFTFTRIHSFLFRTHQLPEPMIQTDAMARSRTLFDANKERRKLTEETTRELFCLGVDKRLLEKRTEGGEELAEIERRVRIRLQSKSGLIRMYLIMSGGRATRRVQAGSN